MESKSIEKKKKLTTNQRIKQNKPIEIWRSRDGLWTWKVWRKYQKPKGEAKNPHARWLVSAQSPFTHDGWEMGDEYCHPIMKNAVKVYDEAEE